jgi:phosphatidylinositol alpha-1,6-mannosyltransferase
MRILMVSSLFAPEIGGVCAVTEALATSLPGQVVVAAPNSRTGRRSQEDLEAYDQRFPFHVHRVPSYETEMPRWLPSRLRGALQFGFNVIWTRRRVMASLRKLLTHQPVDVVCIQTLGTYWIADLLRRYDPGLKVVFYLHGEEIAPSPNPRRLHAMQHHAIRQADAVITVSSFTRELALRAGVSPEKVSVIHNGVDTEQFKPGPKNAAIVQRFGLAGKKVLLCLARLDERKGQDELIESMPTILAAIPEAMLLIVGTGSDEDRLHRLAVASAANESVIFTGHATNEERLAYYQTADVYAMPNRELTSGDTEGFGLVFLEAGACAKPVVGGRAGGVPEAIVEGSTGYLVDGRSTQEISAACINLLSHADLALTMGTNGLEHSRRNTWKIKSQRFLEVCSSFDSRQSSGLAVPAYA